MQNIILMIKYPFITIAGIVVFIGAVINGTIDINISCNKFDVGVSNFKVDGEAKDVSVNKRNINFVTGDLKNVGDVSILEYDLTNKSKVYDANISMECYKEGNKSENFSIEDITPQIIKTGETKKGYIKVTLLKESLTDSNENFYCTMDVKAEKNNK